MSPGEEWGNGDWGGNIVKEEKKLEDNVTRKFWVKDKAKVMRSFWIMDIFLTSGPRLVSPRLGRNNISVLITNFQFRKRSHKF